MLAGAPIYAVLSRQAAEQVRNHCRNWQLDPQQLEAELPALTELRRLTMRAGSTSTGRGGNWLLTIGLAVLAISLALTSD